jgi:hypothetical protein
MWADTTSRVPSPLRLGAPGWAGSVCSVSWSKPTRPARSWSNSWYSPGEVEPRAGESEMKATRFPASSKVGDSVNVAWSGVDVSWVVVPVTRSWTKSS